MKIILLLLLLSGICYAEDFKIKKEIDAGELVKEVEQSTGLILEGKNQIGHISTEDKLVKVKLNDRELTTEEKEKINNVISSHKVKTEEQKKNEKKIKEEKLKTKFGWTDDDLNALKEIFKR